MRRGARRPPSDLPLLLGGSDADPGASFPAHRRLLGSALSVTHALHAAPRRPEHAIPPLPPTPSWTRLRDPEHAHLWQAAVAEHCHLARVAQPEAEAALVALSEHLERAARLAWAPEPGLFARAVEECLLVSVFDADVASRHAQRAWRRWWVEQPYGPAVGPRDAVTMVRDEARRERELRADWAAAWALWAARARLHRSA
ncbi:hypothetical protein CLV35_0293 [Motilibacter peucedani]|uniref:Uncharacterized protein n=1 Tax=Motilibacter peucedani TaxID=598650 RepID=A0A420XV45_9ACTN|nr:hypothetical protein CLV35_0293 [Motilibacter peucedani]